MLKKCLSLYFRQKINIFTYVYILYSKQQNQYYDRPVKTVAKTNIVTITEICIKFGNKR